jgi:DNA-binding GntR family transcriptional regulator
MLHELVIKNCGNSRLQKIIAGLRDQVQTFRVLEGHQPEVVRQVMRERWDILNALKDRDGDRAEELLMHHIQGVKERRLAQLPHE